jgi:signal transduction histidine kinase
MTHGTSAQGGNLSGYRTDAGQDTADAAWLWPAATLDSRLDWRDDWPRIARAAAALQLPALGVILGLALGLMATMAWHTPTDAALPVMLLLATGAAVGLIGLRPHNRVGPARRGECKTSPHAPSQLLAQMHHELRTPLNAMIGFSEVMLQELHGPLGNARYQEYAAHISESGGRLLRASEDALAVAATMSALVADRRLLRRERLPAAALLQEAWAATAPTRHPGRSAASQRRAALRSRDLVKSDSSDEVPDSLACGSASGTTGETPVQDIRLSVEDFFAVEVHCDWEASSQALQHLLGEAIGHTPPGWAITARCRWIGGASGIEIAVEAPAPGHGGEPACPGPEQADHVPAGNGLRVALAGALLEMQGAKLSLAPPHQAERWSACITFPYTSLAGERWRLRERASAGARWPAFPVRRGGFAAGAGDRASADIHAAPRA